MKGTRERKYVFSNVKKDKKAVNKSASKSDEIFDLDNEIVIGLTPLPQPKIEKPKKSKKKQETEDLDFSFKKSNKEKKYDKKSKSKKNKKAPIIKNDKKDENYEKHKRQHVSQNRKNNNIKTVNKTDINQDENNSEMEITVQTEKNSKTKVKVNTKVKKPVNKKQKKKRKFFKIAKWTTLSLILLGGFIYFLLSPVFNIKYINVKSNNQIPAETIISLSNISINQNMFKFNKSNSIKSIKENAYIENVKISRKLFDTIEITVQERYTTFMLRIGGGYAYINNQGYILEMTETAAKVPTIEGYKTAVEDIKVGNRLCVEDLEKLDMVLEIVEAAGNNQIAEIITSIDISNAKNYQLIFAGEGKKAYIGDCSILGTRMLFVKTILEKEIGNDGEIFVDMDLNTEYPFFREKV